jgi:uncharacterized membrane protein
MAIREYVLVTVLAVSCLASDVQPNTESKTVVPRNSFTGREIQFCFNYTI